MNQDDKANEPQSNKQKPKQQEPNRHKMARGRCNCS